MASRSSVRRLSQSSCSIGAYQWSRAVMWWDDPDPPPPPAFTRAWLDKKRQAVGWILYSSIMQILVTLLIVADMWLSYKEMFHDEKEKDHLISSYIVNILLGIEIALRIFVQGKSFFKSALSILEAVIVYGGLFLLVVGRNMPVGIAKAFRPLGRLIKMIRVALKMWLRGAQLKKTADQAIAERIKLTLLSLLQDLIRVRSENLSLHLLDGKFNMRKARLRHEVFEGAHSPIILHGGFVSKVKIDFPVAGMDWTLNRGARLIKKATIGVKEKLRGRHQDGHHLLQVEVDNALIVLGPGPEVNWHDEESIRLGKSRIVDFIQDHFLPSGLPELAPSDHLLATVAADDIGAFKSVTADEALGMGHMIMRKYRFFEKAGKRIFLDMIRRRVVQGAQVRISNIVVQYEDTRHTSSRDFLLGYKLGSLSITAFTHVQGLKQLLPAGHTLSEMSYQRQNSSLRENVSIQLDRVSVFCSIRPSFFYTSLLQTLQFERALEILKRAELLETIRLALAKHGRRSSRSAKTAPLTPCMRRGEPLSLMLQQETYILLPMGIRVNWSIPGLMGAKRHRDPEEDSHAFKISCNPMSVVIDNQQLAVLNFLFGELRSFYAKDRHLHLRPAKKIQHVLPTETHPGQDWHSIAMRRAVVREWWLYALVLVSDTTCTRTQIRTSWFETQVRLARRLEFIELVAHHRFRIKHQGGCFFLTRKIKSVVNYLRPRPARHHMNHIEERLGQLQIRMSFWDIVLSTMEARYVAAQREADTRHRRKRRIHVNIWGRSRPSIKGDILRHFDENPEQQADALRDDLEAIFVHLEEMGVVLKAFMPEYVSLRLPVLELCLFMVSKWKVPHCKGSINPPRFHPNGTRHKFLHAWITDAGSILYVEFVERGGDRFLPWFRPQACQMFVKGIGARYCDTRTGDERQALGFRPIPHDEDGRFLVAYFTRSAHANLAKMSKLNPTAISQLLTISRSGGKSNEGTTMLPWKGSLYVGEISVRPEVQQLRKIVLFVGDLGRFAFERFMQWLLAEPFWRVHVPEIRFSEAQPTREQHKIDESDLRQYLHRIGRLAELLLCVVLPVDMEVHLEINSWGCHSCILQPEWTQNQWNEWLDQHLTPYGGFPGRRPKDPVARMIECKVSIPRLRPVLLRTPEPRLTFELLPLHSDEELQSTESLINDTFWEDGSDYEVGVMQSMSPSRVVVEAGPPAYNSQDTRSSEFEVRSVAPDNVQNPPRICGSASGLMETHGLEDRNASGAHAIGKYDGLVGTPLGMSTIKSHVIVAPHPAHRSLSSRDKI